MEVSEKKLHLDTPLSAMLPPRYKDMDVTKLFPEFRHGQVLRFTKLFGLGKPSNLPQIWRGVRNKRKNVDKYPCSSKKHREEVSLPLSPAEKCDPDETKLMKLEEKKVGTKNESSETNLHSPSFSAWRYGPASFWYDMINVPESAENFDYGFQAKEPSSNLHDGQLETDALLDSEYPDDAFFMVTQCTWEDDVIWNGEEVKQMVLSTSNQRNSAAGWVPSIHQRTASAFRCEYPLDKDSSYSIFPVENEELVNGNWEDDVIWDSKAMTKIPEPKVLTLDLNDENIILELPMDDPSSDSSTSNQPVKEKKDMFRKSQILLGKAGVISETKLPNSPPPEYITKDPFNISNDEFYNPRMTHDASLKSNVGSSLIQHSIPAIDLHPPFFPTHMGPSTLRQFHRQPLKRFSRGSLAQPGFHSVLSLHKHIRQKNMLRKEESQAAGGGEIFFMRTPADLTGKDGELILAEYSEEHPPLLMQVGMATKIQNYCHKRNPGKGKGGSEYKYGETVYTDTFPFLGTLEPGQSIQAFENNLFRSPIYEQELPKTDFLIIRTRQHYFIREVECIYTVGQELPLLEVPRPNSKKATHFIKNFLKVFIYRAFLNSEDNPRRIKMEDIKKAFPSYSESSMRKILKGCADFKRTGIDSNWWVLKSKFRLPNEDEIRAMLSPEQCCAYYGMLAAERRLKRLVSDHTEDVLKVISGLGQADTLILGPYSFLYPVNSDYTSSLKMQKADAGYGEKSLFEIEKDEEMQSKMDDEVKTAPWNTTRAFIAAMKGKCLLDLTGVADPTGCGEGFSYVPIPNKPQHTKEFCSNVPAKRAVTGTNADLRRLSLNNAKQLLQKYNVPEAEIEKLSRWEVIDVVRTLSTKQEKTGEDAMNKFARRNPFSIAEHHERYKEDSQRIFDLQNRVLSSNELLSSEEDSSSDNDSEIEEMGKNIEYMLSNENTSYQFRHECEEAGRRELQKLILREDSVKEEGKRKKDKKKTESEDDNAYVQSTGSNSNKRILKIHRTFKDPDGKEYFRIETVRNPSVIDAYVHIRTTKEPSSIKQFVSTLDDHQKEEFRKERKRILEQLRRLKRSAEKEKHIIPKKKVAKETPVIKLKCGACGVIGHMRTNKVCPFYRPTAPVLPVQVAMTEAQEQQERADLEDYNLVGVEETKVILSKQLVKHTDQVSRKSLILKFKTEAAAMRKQKQAGSVTHHDNLTRPHKLFDRQRTSDVNEHNLSDDLFASDSEDESK